MFNRISMFHRNKRGNESMQTILIMAVGALLMIGLSTFFNSEDVSGRIRQHVSDLLETTMTF